MDIEAFRTDNSAPFLQWPCGIPPQSNQLFWFAWAPGFGQDFQVVNYNSNRCMDVQYGSTAPQAPVWQWDCTFGGTNPVQRWHHY
jgi:galactose oxidase